MLSSMVMLQAVDSNLDFHEEILKQSCTTVEKKNIL